MQPLGVMDRRMRRSSSPVLRSPAEDCSLTIEQVTRLSVSTRPLSAAGAMPVGCQTITPPEATAVSGKPICSPQYVSSPGHAGACHARCASTPRTPPPSGTGCNASPRAPGTRRTGLNTVPSCGSEAVDWWSARFAHVAAMQDRARLHPSGREMGPVGLSCARRPASPRWRSRRHSWNSVSHCFALATCSPLTGGFQPGASCACLMMRPASTTRWFWGRSLPTLCRRAHRFPHPVET